MTIPLTSEIKPFFSVFEEHVIKKFLTTAQGILSARTTNLNIVKDKLPGILENQQNTKPDSNYKRLIRFFNMDDADKQALIEAILCFSFYLLRLKAKNIKYLALDGTSWENGNKNIHLLTLSVVVNGVSIPIWWEDLDKKGMSNFNERRKVIDKACKLYNLKGLILLADREYIGERWFEYLIDKGLEFVIRLKKGIYQGYVDNQRGKDKTFYKHQHLRYIGIEREALKKRYQICGVSKQIEILGKKFSFVIFKNPKSSTNEPLFYFISTLKDKRKIVKLYPIRWTIETCFKHLKSNGFNLEALNFKDSGKIKLTMGIVVFIYALCIEQGLTQLKHKKKSDWKKYKNGSINLVVSKFKKGLSFLEIKFNNLRNFICFLSHSIRSIPKPSWLFFEPQFIAHVQ